MILTNWNHPIWIYKTGDTIFYKIAIKSKLFELSFEYSVTVRRGPLVSWAHASTTRNRGDGLLDAKPTELADSGVSGDEDGTSVTTSTSHVD